MAPCMSRPRATRPRLIALCGVLLAGVLSGCSSTPTDSDTAGLSAMPGELTVVVWSKELQALVPARGRVTSLSSQESVPFDTQGQASTGLTLTLSPGRYSVLVEQRYDSSGSVQQVSGERVLYVEPGARETLEVVVTDRKELGRLRPSSAQASPQIPSAPRSSRAAARARSSFPEASTLPLPLESASG